MKNWVKRQQGTWIQRSMPSAVPETLEAALSGAMWSSSGFFLTVATSSEAGCSTSGSLNSWMMRSVRCASSSHPFRITCAVQSSTDPSTSQRLHRRRFAFFSFLTFLYSLISIVDKELRFHWTPQF